MTQVVSDFQLPARVRYLRPIKLSILFSMCGELLCLNLDRHFVYFGGAEHSVLFVPLRDGFLASSRAIAVGLELLVAADIVGTVVVAPTIPTVGVLALIIAVRTFLSFVLEVEINGHWPWQRTSLIGDSNNKKCT